MTVDQDRQVQATSSESSIDSWSLTSIISLSQYFFINGASAGAKSWAIKTGTEQCVANSKQRLYFRSTSSNLTRRWPRPSLADRSCLGGGSTLNRCPERFSQMARFRDEFTQSIDGVVVTDATSAEIHFASIYLLWSVLSLRTPDILEVDECVLHELFADDQCCIHEQSPE